MPRRCYLTLAVALYCFGTLAWARSNLPDPLTQEDFKGACLAHQVGASDFRIADAPEVGFVGFLPTLALVGNQGRFSWASVQRKLKKALNNDPDTYYDKKNNQWILNHDDGRSFFPIERKIRAIYYRGKIYIQDGHHRAMISAFLGAETIPVQIVADWSKRFSPAQLDAHLDRTFASYFRNYQGRSTPRVALCDMKDDPTLELARRLFARVDAALVGGRLKIANLRGPKTAIGIKTDQDMSFLEFEVADALHRAGWEWDPDADFDDDYLNAALAVLNRAAKNPNSRLDQVLLLKQATVVEDLDLQPLLLDHLKDVGCKWGLAPKRRSQ